MSTAREHGEAMQELMAYAVLFQDAVARKAGLNGTDLQCLGLLIRQGPMTAGALAEQAGLTAGGAITKVIDKLTEAGLASRSPDAADRRRVLVSADAAAAWQRLSPWYASVTERWSAYLDGLEPAQADLVLQAIRAAAAINRDEVARFRIPG